MTQSCPICDCRIVEIHDDMVRALTHHGVRYETTLINTVCTECGVDYCDGSQIDANFLRWQTLCDSIPDYISPSNIMKVREIYDFSQSNAASYFGVSFNEWRMFEKGEVHPNRQLTNEIKRAIDDVEFMIDKILASRPLKNA